MDDITKELLEKFRWDMRRARKMRGWTQQDAAERLTEAGWHADRTMVAKIECGARGIGLGEAFVYARAMGVNLTWTRLIVVEDASEVAGVQQS